VAERPIYLVTPLQPKMVRSIGVEFEWHPGFALIQKQKSIHSLHTAARKVTDGNLLEISSKSPDELGRRLSAFSLFFNKVGWPRCPVECAFQGSKVFEGGGPFTDLYSATAREAKKDARLKNAGNLLKFSLLGEDWPIKPRTYFYDWLYINALDQNQTLSKQLMGYQGFTDIEFNPAKSINCQAHSAALYLALHSSGQLDNILTARERLETILRKSNDPKPVQGILI
jgi:hypothetical protein